MGWINVKLWSSQKNRIHKYEHFCCWPYCCHGLRYFIPIKDWAPGLELTWLGRKFCSYSPSEGSNGRGRTAELRVASPDSSFSPSLKWNNCFSVLLSPPVTCLSGIWEDPQHFRKNLAWRKSLHGSFMPLRDSCAETIFLVKKKNQSAQSYYFKRFTAVM